MEHLRDLKPFVEVTRRQLHQIPEIGLMEWETSNYIQSLLLEMEIPFEVVLNTGVIGYIEVPGAHSTVAYRADIDALPIHEETSYPYPSQNKGYMHACGHDAHMSILLGFAKFIMAHKRCLTSNIVLIFQPAEEGPGGAQSIIALDILKKYNVDEIFGLHVFPEIEFGKVGTKSGPIMAMVGEFDIHIKAKGAHGAMPHMGIDGLVVASECILGLQTIISRNINPIYPAVLTIGKVMGGERRNILAGNVYLEGTIRTFDKDVYETIKARMAQYLSGIKLAYDIDIEVIIRDLYPPVINDDALFAVFKRTFGSRMIEMESQMISEDFAYYQEVVPGLFYFLGTRMENKGYTYPLHSPHFDLDDDSLVLGIYTFIKLLKARGGFTMTTEEERALDEQFAF